MTDRNLPADLVSRLRDADMGDDHSTQKLLMDAACEIGHLRDREHQAAARWLQMQSSDEIRDRIMARLS